MILYSNCILIEKRGGLQGKSHLSGAVAFSTELSGEKTGEINTPMSLLTHLAPNTLFASHVSQTQLSAKEQGTQGAVKAGQSTRSQSRAEEGGHRGHQHPMAKSSNQQEEREKSLRPKPHDKLGEFT